MVKVERTFVVDRNIDAVVGYLKDFANAQAWDPGTKSCTRIGGDGDIEVGAQWHNVSELRGRETELTYRLERLQKDHLTFVGRNKTATSTDDITFTPVPGAKERTTITYRAHIVFHGIAKLADPFMKSIFEKLGDQTESQMKSVIGGL